MIIDICVPTYNSLEYLKILVHGLRKYTRYFKYNLIVHDNGSEDGTEEWLKENDISYTRSKTNLGFCGVNQALKQAQNDYVMIFNADMFPLPNWDLNLWRGIKKFKPTDKFTISCRLIEPVGNNPEYIQFYAGHNAETFDEKKLWESFKENLGKWKVESSTPQVGTIQYSHPILMPRTLMEEINYLDETYFPGWSVDHDLAASAYKAGCRHFWLPEYCNVYHFVSKTFTKLPNNVKNKDGQDIFLKKWGITVDEFRKRLGVKEPYNKVPDDIL